MLRATFSELAVGSAAIAVMIAVMAAVSPGCRKNNKRRGLAAEGGCRRGGRWETQALARTIRNARHPQGTITQAQTQENARHARRLAEREEKPISLFATCAGMLAIRN